MTRYVIMGQIYQEIDGVRQGLHIALSYESNMPEITGQHSIAVPIEEYHRAMDKVIELEKKLADSP